MIYAATPDQALDLAERIQQGGFVLLLIVLVITFGWMLYKLFNRAMDDKNATIERLLLERDQAQKRERDLHAYIDDVVLPLVTEANRATSRTMRRVLDET